MDKRSRGIGINGDMFRDLRMTAGLTQESLADLANCDVTTVRKAERGRRIDLTVLGRLVDVLKTDVATVAASGLRKDEEKRNLEVADRWDKAFFARNLERVMSFHHPDVELVIPSSDGLPGGGNFKGIDAVREQMIVSLSLFDQAEQHSRQIHAVNDLVFLRADTSFRLTETGNTFRAHFLNELKFKEGLIIHRTVITDYEGLRKGLVDVT